MVSSINYSDWDLNSDGVADAKDLAIATQNGTAIPDEVKTKLTTGSVTISKDEETTEVTDDTTTETDETEPSIALPEMPEVSTYTTAADCQTKIDEINTYITTCNDRITVLDTSIATVTKEIEDLTSQRDEAQSAYDLKSAEVEKNQSELSGTIKAVASENENYTTEMDNSISSAVNQAVTDYVNGEDPDSDLNAMISSRLDGIGLSTATLDSLADKATGLGMTISDNCSALETIGGTVRNLNIQIKDKQTELDGYKSEKTGLTTAVTTANSYLTQLKAKQSELAAAEAAAACEDPIGFEKNGTNYDFITDRDKDGTFDGSSEFLGAKNGFSELQSYDTNGDGKINGKELESLKLLKTGSNGETSFSTASKAGIQEIDLESYQSKNEDIGNGNTLTGNYNLTFNNEQVQGYQTLDTKSSLKEKYGEAYGDKINSSSNENLFSATAANIFSLEVANKVDTGSINLATNQSIAEASSSIQSTKFNAESKSENYSYTNSAQVESNKKSEYESAQNDKKAEETKKEETAKTEKKEKTEIV